MNIEGNKVIWNQGNAAITENYKGYIVYKQVTAKNEDGTAFRYWSEQAILTDLDEAIALAKTL